ncbi:hypothetical protein CcCBS67573_g04299 [Chytriomyces confervae]|uniref:C2H2-type domain-containing protein n=1 Tax=Chytriomyces confervae TaxID=246404 RepID=A0A507FFQ8_9FUNG|nr:hypothetical protein CcCBS67573_g04299 [Chytriomyces confervae]
MQDSIYNFENGHILQDFMFDSNDFSRGSSVEREEEGVLLLQPFRLEFTSANPSLRSTEEEVEDKHEWSSSSSSRTTTSRRECVARISSVEIEKESDTEFASNPATCHTAEMDLLTLVNVDDNAAAGQETVADLEEASKARADASEAYSPAESTSSEWTPLQSQTFNRDSRGDHHHHRHHKGSSIHATTSTLSIYTTTATLPSLSAQHATTIESSPSSESTPTEATSSKPLKQRRPPPAPRLSPSFSSTSYSTDSRPREHECSVCHNRFLRRQDLSRHLSSHTHQFISADDYLRQLLLCDSEQTTLDTTEPIQRFNNNNNSNCNNDHHDGFHTSATATPQSAVSSPTMLLYTITPQQESPILSNPSLPILLKRESKRVKQQPASSSSSLPTTTATSTSTALGSIPNAPLRQREFRCTHCPATFWRKQDAQRHEVTHGSARAFACPNLCGKKFARRDALGRHLKSSKCNSGSV